ncbi:MAG: hypothetical protein COA38_08210 [Fluviicola sp.]|nr:MAG: hypothetical protein COA38_08210 [Fluviicola sp.]
MKPNQLRASNAIKALYATMITMTITSIAAYVLLYMISSASMNFEDMGSYLGQIQTYSIFAGIFGLIHLGIYITCIVLFIMWFRRAYFNLHNLVPHNRLKYSEGWAAGTWFIPIFNLFGPFQIATDLFSQSEKLLVEKGLMEKQPKYHQVKGWWWGLWIASIVLNQVSRNTEDVSIVMFSIVLGILILLATIGAGLLAIQMIKNYSKMEELLKKIPLEEGGIATSIITNDDLLDSGI